MHHHGSLLVYCCLGIQLVASALVIGREYYRPYPNDPAGAKMNSLRPIMYIVCLISWIGIAIAQWALWTM
jgi:hypothetical protein